MERASVHHIAKATGLHSNTIRRWADTGILPCVRDFRNWRWFPRPLETLKRVEDLKNGRIKLEHL